MTRAERLATLGRLKATAEKLAGEPCTLGMLTPCLATFRSQSGFTVHVWDGGDAVLVPPVPPRPRPPQRHRVAVRWP